MTNRMFRPLSAKQRLGMGGAALLAVGAAGGAGAVSLTRPAIEMAPTVSTAIAKLPSASGIVTIRGRVAEAYGDRLIVQDQSARAMVDIGPNGGNAPLTTGSAVLVQGRYNDGQLRARFLVDGEGRVSEVGPRPPHDRRGPPPPPPAADAPPPPPGAGAPPPPPGAGAPQPVGRDGVPPPPASNTAPPPSPAPGPAPAASGGV